MDYRKVAIEELRHLNELRTAETVCRDRLSDLNDRLRSLKIPSPQTGPVQGGGSRTEDRWLTLITAKSDEELRLRNVRRRLKRFDTAWVALTERDRNVLNAFYIAGHSRSADSFAEHEHIDRRTAFRWRDAALISFSRVFFGAVID